MSTFRKLKWTAFAPYLVSTCMLVTLASCGSDDDDDDDDSPIPQREEQIEGSYRAVLIPANPSVDSDVTGFITVNLVGDQMTVEVEMQSAPPSMHQQHIHTGSACATPADDANADGVVDAVEAAPIAGKVLVPLDGDLNSQEAGNQSFPSGESYNDSEEASYEQLITDLTMPDNDPTDSVVKLARPEDFVLEGRVVEIHGVPNTTSLPDTAQGMDGMSAQSSLPIACGVLVRTSGGTTGN